jgi:hypothetical protein
MAAHATAATTEGAGAGRGPAEATVGAGQLAGLPSASYTTRWQRPRSAVQARSKARRAVAEQVANMLGCAIGADGAGGGEILVAVA